MSALHPTVEKAAAGTVPPWGSVSDSRYAHMERVAKLLDGWAVRAGCDEVDRRRWRALGFLHDACKGVDADELRGWLGDEARGIPDPVLHGPAAARRLVDDGVDDPALVHAVAWHTLGHPELRREGLALYAADFLEPGRDLRNAWRAGLRAKMPSQMERVVTDILRARIEHLLKRKRPVHGHTMAFWNRMAEGDGWARASEV